jgi:hypothetical protein
VDLGLALRGRQIEQGFLDLRRELIERHDLAYARLSNVTSPCQFDRVRHFASAEHLMEADRECHQLGDTRHAVGGPWSWWFRVRIVRTNLDTVSRSDADV